MLIPGRIAVENKFIFNPSGRPIEGGNVKEASVDLTVGKMLTSHGAKIFSPKDEIIVKPQQTAVIISEECFNIPSGVIAQALMKNRMSQDGLIAFNTGIIDSGYQKPISTMVTNLSKNDILINRGQAFLRIVFHRLDGDASIKAIVPKPIARADVAKHIHEYEGYRKIDIAKLPKDFFSVGEIKESIVKELKEASISKFFMILGGVVSVIVLSANIGIPKIQSYLYEDSVAKSEEKIKLLEMKVHALESQLNYLFTQKMKEYQKNQ